MADQRELSPTAIATWAVQNLIHAMYQQGASLTAEIDRRVAKKSADYTEGNMPLAMAYKAREAVRRYTATRIGGEGLFLEFGVWVGESINLFASLFPNKTIHGFDSFEGLQEDWAGTHNHKGTFDLGGKLPTVRENVVLHKGWFSETLLRFLEQHPEPVAFVHIDCDTGPSAKQVLETLDDRIVAGTVILFDEYINYRGWEQGEFLAWREFRERKGIKYEYLAFATEGQQVSLKVTSVGSQRK
jgi:hypothetical protein